MYTFLPAMMTYDQEVFQHFLQRNQVTSVSNPHYHPVSSPQYSQLAHQFLQHFVSNNSHFFILLLPFKCTKIQNNRNTPFLLIYYIFV